MIEIAKIGPLRPKLLGKSDFFEIVNEVFACSYPAAGASTIARRRILNMKLILGSLQARVKAGLMLASELGAGAS